MKPISIVLPAGLTWEQLDRYLARECSLEECRTIEAQLAAADGQISTVVAALRANGAIRREQVDAVTTAVLARIAGGEGAESQHDVAESTRVSEEVPRGRLRSTRPIANAAFLKLPSWIGKHSVAYGLIATMAIVLAFGWEQYVRPAHPIDSAQSRTYTTKTAQQAIVELADGSRMFLAPNTRATVATNAGVRTITLQGEAHFEVLPDPKIAFIVRTGAVTTRVLGTTFDVRHYPGNRDGEILVSSGRVVVSGDVDPVKRSILLTSGMMGRFRDSIPTVVAADAAMTVDWTQGRLIFREAPVSDVLVALKRWYGYDFRVADSTLAKRHITAVFLLGDSADMLRLMQRVLDMHMTFDDSVVTLRQRRRDARQAPTRIQMRDADPTFKEIGR